MPGGLATIGRPRPIGLGNGLRLDQTTPGKHMRVLSVTRPTAFSIEAWITMNGTATWAGQQTVFSFFTSGIIYVDLRLNQPAGTTTVFTVGGFANSGAGGASIASTTQFPLGVGTTRHHLVLTSVAGRLNYYCDGVLTNTSANNTPSGAGTLFIGSVNGAGNYLAADIHEYRFYDRELTQQEILMRYLNGQASDQLDSFEQTPAGIWLKFEGNTTNSGSWSGYNAVPYAAGTANGFTPGYVTPPEYA